MCRQIPILFKLGLRVTGTLHEDHRIFMSQVLVFTAQTGTVLCDRQIEAEEKVISLNTEWPKKMYTLFTHQYLWN